MHGGSGSLERGVFVDGMKLGLEFQLRLTQRKFRMGVKARVYCWTCLGESLIECIEICGCVLGAQRGHARREK